MDIEEWLYAIEVAKMSTKEDIACNACSRNDEALNKALDGKEILDYFTQEEIDDIDFFSEWIFQLRLNRSLDIKF